MSKLQRLLEIEGYSSMASVTLMIAREMTKEIVRRQSRMAGAS